VSTLAFTFPTDEITEGRITFLVPQLALYARGNSEYIPSKTPVFYNPLMELNRDVAVLALQVFQKTRNIALRVCDPLTGCGIRGLRFARELENIESIVLNDRNHQAFRLAHFNVIKNDLMDKIEVKNMDAKALLASYAGSKGFDAIDVDPYGSPSPFLDSALIALQNRGLLALTATDTAPLCGVNPKACVRKYLGKPLRTEYCHELGLRLLISSVVLSAARYDFGVKTLFSHSTNHYLRVYLQLRRGAQRANASIETLGYVLHCFKCLNRLCIQNLLPHLDLRCKICGSSMVVSGPLWLGSLADGNFCRMLCKNAEQPRFRSKTKLVKLLKTINGEFTFPPTYYLIDKICATMGVSAVSRDGVIEYLNELGYLAAKTHFNPRGIKTTASIQAIEKAIDSLL
jgi:tRNA (guanine26-N2/guanine27-N2)-dimethyltransferase